MQKVIRKYARALKKKKNEILRRDNVIGIKSSEGSGEDVKY